MKSAGLKKAKIMRLGIDPGITGAIALLDTDDVIWVRDMPTMAKASGKGNQVNPFILADIVCDAIEEAEKRGSKLTVYLERVNAMPGQGVTSVFSFGMSTGIVQGVIGAKYLPLIQPTSMAWKKRAGLTGKEKDVSRTLAIQQHPEIAEELRRKKDVGRADAIFIAKFGE